MKRRTSSCTDPILLVSFEPSDCNISDLATSERILVFAVASLAKPPAIEMKGTKVQTLSVVHTYPCIL